MRIFYLFLLWMVPILGSSQIRPNVVDEIALDLIKPQTIQHLWLKVIDDGMSQAVTIPVIVAKGTSEGPVLGLTAALHGNELNGIRVIQKLMEDLDIATLKGTIIAIPGLNVISIPIHQRRYVDEEDLNRNFPGKEKGNRSQQYVWQIGEKVLSKIDYLVDMHTASFGRVNTLYVRADLSNPKMAEMAKLQNADIILSNKGVPSAAQQIAATRTMRAEAVLKGIPSITVEYGNPQVFQPELTERGKLGIQNIMSWLNMTPQPVIQVKEAFICKKSYWLFVDKGGYLEVPVSLNQKLKKGDLIGTLRDPFGTIIKEYYCPEDGIVIGKSSNPINMSGGRIIHLGIPQN